MIEVDQSGSEASFCLLKPARCSTFSWTEMDGNRTTEDWAETDPRPELKKGHHAGAGKSKAP